MSFLINPFRFAGPASSGGFIAASISTGGTAAQVAVYPWSSSGFGERFANPASYNSLTQSNSVAFTPLSDAIALAHSQSPYYTAYPWSSSGFGAKYANPATLPTSGINSLTFNSSADVIASSSTSSPYVHTYPWSSSGFGTKYANPATTAPRRGNQIGFTPSGDALAFAHTRDSPFVAAYPWTGSGFGAKYANPATAIIQTTEADDGIGLAFAPSGDAVVVGTDSGGNFRGAVTTVHAYQWSSSGFGAKYAGPSTFINSVEATSLSFTSSGDALGISSNNSGGNCVVHAYPWTGSGFGTKYADPATYPNMGAYGVAFTPSDDAIAVAHHLQSTGFVGVVAYQWSSSGFGAKIADPSTPISSSSLALAVAFTP